MEALAGTVFAAKRQIFFRRGVLLHQSVVIVVFSVVLYMLLVYLLSKVIIEPEETEYPIGKYGMLRKIYLQEHRKGLYLELVLAGKLNEHLHQIDKECNQMMDRLVEQMKEKQGVTEELKMQDQMAWVGKMNNIRACAEEIVIHAIIIN